MRNGLDHRAHRTAQAGGKSLARRGLRTRAAGLVLGACFCAAWYFLAVAPQRPHAPSSIEGSSLARPGGPAGPAAGHSPEMERAALYVSVEAVLSMMKNKQDILLVDVRAQEAFAAYRLPGSIRIPLHALKSKPFLKDGRVVLVSEGYPRSALEEACRELRAAGFAQLSILNGGLRCWQEKNGPIEGEAFAALEGSRIAPLDFFSQQGAGEWLVVAVSPSASAAGQARKLIPGARHLPWEGTPATFAADLKAIIAGHDPSPLLSVLVCDAGGTQYDAIERAIRKAGIGKVFYLGGGLDAYAALLERQALLRKPGQEEVKRCATCS
jgi:rhodanese-related sulfurtransferase